MCYGIDLRSDISVTARHTATTVVSRSRMGAYQPGKSCNRLLV